MKLLTGNSNKILSKNIAKYLKSKLVNSSIRKFADGEIYIEINENIRGNSIFIIQSISSPANDNLMELLLCIDALKRSSAKNITAVIPYFGYARQDRKVVPRTSISAKLVSNLITKAGADRVVTVDLHAGQIQGFFDIPVDNLFSTPDLPHFGYEPSDFLLAISTQFSFTHLRSPMLPASSLSSHTSHLYRSTRSSFRSILFTAWCYFT